MYGWKNENGIKVERDCDRYMLVMYIGNGTRCEGKKFFFLQIEEENYWQKTFLNVDFPLNEFQNDVLKDRISIHVVML